MGLVVELSDLDYLGHLEVDMFLKVEATIWYQSFPAKPTLITEQHG